jgi:hypothetical protein
MTLQEPFPIALLAPVISMGDHSKGIEKVVGTLENVAY